MRRDCPVEKAPWWTRSIGRIGLCLAVLVAVCALATELKAFKIGVTFNLGPFNVVSLPPIHEGITASAISSVMPQANPVFISSVQSGVFNTDLSHQPIAAFHFDKSTTTNGGFENGFDTLHGMLATAAGDAQICCDASGNSYINPLFLNPQHSSFRDLVEDVVGTYTDLSLDGSCLAELACPTDQFAGGAAYVQAEMLPILLDSDPDPDEVAAYTFQTPIGNNCCSLFVPNFADTVAEVKSNLDSLLGQHCRPDWAGGQCFDVLEEMCPDDNSFQLLAGHLRILEYEYQAYYAWQHLGHGLHTTQDFFAHSNYVELAAGHKGPPCAPSSNQAANLCGTPLEQGTVPLAGILLPTDLAVPIDLAQFAWVFNTKFDVNTGRQWIAEALKQSQFPAAFADGNFNHLQTGDFPCPSDANGAVQSLPAPGFLYCHTGTDALGSAPGMNKDEGYSSGGELNHMNHQWALESANRMSVILFWSFMNSLPNGNSYLVTPNSVLLAANPMHLPIASSTGSPLHVGSVPMINKNFPATLESTPFQNLNLVQQPTAQATRSGLPGNLTGPPRPGPLNQFPPHLVTIAGRPVPIRTLPRITRPELLQPDPRRHIFVKTFPNRAFRPGERVTLRVDAFDAQTGAQLRDLPVVIGSVRGLTSRPIPLTIAAATAQRCSAIGGQQFCLNVLAPVKATVIVPPDRYPGAGGSFTLSVISPKLLTGVVGGPVIRPDTAFTVTALDAHTHRPVPGAEVSLGQTKIGQANQAIPYHLPALRPVQTKNRLGAVETLPASFGPPMIVRAPGYSDEVVHYVLSNAVPLIRR